MRCDSESCSRQTTCSCKEHRSRQVCAIATGVCQQALHVQEGLSTSAQTQLQLGCHVRGSRAFRFATCFCGFVSSSDIPQSRFSRGPVQRRGAIRCEIRMQEKSKTPSSQAVRSAQASRCEHGGVSHESAGIWMLSSTGIRFRELLRESVRTAWIALPAPGLCAQAAR